MEKSIEDIWKKGFLNNEAFIAPKINNLYHKKSEHIVEKFTRMFKINLLAIVGGSIFIMGMAWVINIPYMGVGFLFLLNTLAFINFKLMKGLSYIDKNVNSYQYLKSFDSWMKKQTSTNEKISRLLYPLIFLSLCAGFWFGEFGGDVPGEEMVNALVLRYPDMALFFGLPVFLLIGFVLVIALLAYFGGRIYRWDLNIVYGQVLRKLDEIIADMEELRA